MFSSDRSTCGFTTNALWASTRVYTGPETSDWISVTSSLLITVSEGN